MEVYKGDEAVKRYGEKGRNGVVEIRARKSDTSETFAARSR